MDYTVSMSEISGAEFIAKTNPEIQKYIDNSVKQYHHQPIDPELNLKPDKAGDRVEAHFLRLEEALSDPNPKRAERKLNIFKAMVYPQVLVDKDNFPESYFKLQQRIAKERGQGDKEITADKKRKEIETVYTDQKKSLDIWFDYMLDANATYPAWFKYYTLKNVVQLGSYDKKKKQFSKRTQNTTNIFPDLNREALAFVYDVVVKRHLKGLQINDPDFKRIVDSANFGRIYAYAIEKVTPASKEDKQITEGRWVKYDQGSDHMLLCQSLQGHGTGWCTAGEETARIQLETGDFYVYYTKDQQGKSIVPRVAIRMENGQVAEVRGINPDQNLEPELADIAKEKYSQLPGGNKYDKKDQDMRYLTLIEHKLADNQDLSLEDLRFLYEIDSPIEGFGYQKDPRIKSIIEKRNIKQDLSLVFDCRLDQISTTEQEALKGNIKFHYGDLNLKNLTSAEGLVLPENISGDLDLSGLTSTKGLVLPKSVGGYLDLPGLTSAKGLVLPKRIGAGLDLKNLTSAEGLVLPENIGGTLYLPGLTSAEGLVLPENIGGYLDLSGLTSAEGLVLPENISGGLYLSGLTSAEGLVLPENVGGDLNLYGLTSAEGLVLPENFRGTLNLPRLTSAEGLVLPKNIDGSLNLSGFTSAEGLVLPKNVGGNLDLSGLTSTEGLVLPENVGGYLNLSGLTSAEGLVLPKNVGGNLNLSGLTSAEGLVLPENVGGNIYLSKVPITEKKLLRKKYPQLKIV